MADKDGGKRTLSAQISQWEQPKLFSRHFQDSKYVGEKNTFFGGWWSDFSTKLHGLASYFGQINTGQILDAVIINILKVDSTAPQVNVDKCLSQR